MGMSFKSTIPINADLDLKINTALMQIKLLQAEKTYSNIERVVWERGRTFVPAKCSTLVSHYYRIEYAFQCLRHFVGARLPKQQSLSPTKQFLKSFVVHMHRNRCSNSFPAASFPVCFTFVLNVFLGETNRVKALKR